MSPIDVGLAGLRLLALAAIAFLYSASSAIAGMAASLYVLDITGSRVALTLTVAAYNTAFAASSLLLVGRGRRLGLPVALTSIALSSLAMYATTSAAAVAAFNAAYGFSAAFIQPLIMAAASRLVGEAEAVPRINMASSAGIAVGDLLAAALSPSLGARGLLLVSALLALSATPFAAVSRTLAARPRPPVASAPPVTGRARYSPPVAAPVEGGGEDVLPVGFYLSILAFFTAVSIFFSPMPAYLRRVGFTDSEIYILSMIALLTSTAVYEVLRRMRVGVATALKLLVLVAAARTAIFLAPLPAFHGLVDPKKLMPLVYMFTGGTWAMISTALPVVALRLGGGERGLGRVNAMMSLGLMAGSFLATPLTALAAWDATCTAASLAVGLAAVAYALTTRNIAAPPASPQR